MYCRALAGRSDVPALVREFLLSLLDVSVVSILFVCVSDNEKRYVGTCDFRDH